jgi:hypothetical protein
MQGIDAHGSGWVPDSPDPRDFHYDGAAVCGPLSRLRPANANATDISLEEFIESDFVRRDRHSAAWACLAHLEYLHRRSLGHGLSASSGFLAHITGYLQSCSVFNAGTIRNTLKVIRRFGVPPSKLWDASQLPHEQRLHDPSLFAYSDHRSLVYFRLSGSADAGSSCVLRNIKAFLTAGFPIIFGVTVPASAADIHQIVYRQNTKPGAGYVLLAIGFDDRRGVIRFLGESELGWCQHGLLPYEMILADQCGDFWSCFQPELLNDDFRRPRLTGHNNSRAS